MTRWLMWALGLLVVALVAFRLSMPRDRHSPGVERASEGAPATPSLGAPSPGPAGAGVAEAPSTVVVLKMPVQARSDPSKGVGPLTIAVRDTDGFPIEGASVEASEGELGSRRELTARTDRYGQCHIAEFRRGSVHIKVRCDGYVRMEETLSSTEPKPGRIDVVLRRGVRLRGRVVWPSDPSSPKDPLVYAHCLTTEKGTGSTSSMSDWVVPVADGTFEFQGLPTYGDATLYAWAVG